MPNHVKSPASRACCRATSRRSRQYQALNVAKGLGRIHVIPKLDEHVEIGFNEILVLDEVPVQLPPVAGVITSHPSTPLSHINLLAKGWGVPNAYIKDATTLLKQYDGWWVEFETRRDSYSIKRADVNQLREYQRRLAQRLDVMKPPLDLAETRMLGLAQQRSRASLAYGGKSANLRRSDERAPARHRRAKRFHNSFLLLRRLHQGEQSRRRDLCAAERSEVCARPGLSSREARRICASRSSRRSLTTICGRNFCAACTASFRARVCLSAVLQTRKTCQISAAPASTQPFRMLRKISN